MGKAAAFMLPKDYLRYCLTGEIYTEFSDAAATMLWNPQAKAWDKALGEEFGIPDIYPDVLQSHDKAGTFNALLAAELGLGQTFQSLLVVLIMHVAL